MSIQTWPGEPRHQPTKIPDAQSILNPSKQEISMSLIKYPGHTCNNAFLPEIQISDICGHKHFFFLFAVSEKPRHSLHFLLPILSLSFKVPHQSQLSHCPGHLELCLNGTQEAAVF